MTYKTASNEPNKPYPQLSMGVNFLMKKNERERKHKE